MSKYIEELPLVIRNAIKGLCDEKRQGILIYLKKKGPKSFIDIAKEFDLSKANLSHHLRNLMKTGLIYNFYQKNELNDKYSYYEISKLGKIIIENLKSMVLSNENRESKYFIHELESSMKKGVLIAVNYGENTMMIIPPSLLIAKETYRFKKDDSTEVKLDNFTLYENFMKK